MKEIIFIVEEAAEGGFIAKAIGESIFTEADTLDDLKTNIKDAINCHFDDKEKKPQIIRIHFVKDEVIAV